MERKRKNENMKRKRKKERIVLKTWEGTLPPPLRAKRDFPVEAADPPMAWNCCDDLGDVAVVVEDEGSFCCERGDVGSVVLFYEGLNFFFKRVWCLRKKWIKKKEETEFFEEDKNRILSQKDFKKKRIQKKKKNRRQRKKSNPDSAPGGGGVIWTTPGAPLPRIPPAKKREKKKKRREEKVRKEEKKGRGKWRKPRDLGPGLLKRPLIPDPLFAPLSALFSSKKKKKRKQNEIQNKK